MSNLRTKPGDRIGNYYLIEPIESGGFAQVWKAKHHERAGRIVAIKMALDSALVKQLRREGQLPEISHPNVVPILDTDTRSDPPYVVMPFYPAGSLRKMIADNPKGMPEERATAILEDILAGLSAAHSRGIIHRDVKPGNILIDQQGRGLIADFGLSLCDAPDGQRSIVQSVSRLQESSGTLAGTLGYMAPEVLHGGEPTTGSDIYSVGLLLFEMLTGRLPAGLEFPSHVRTNLKNGELYDRLFYGSCGPIATRYPDAPSMKRALQDGPEPIPWKIQPDDARLEATDSKAVRGVGKQRTIPIVVVLLALSVLLGTVLFVIISSPTAQPTQSILTDVDKNSSTSKVETTEEKQAQFGSIRNVHVEESPRQVLNEKQLETSGQLDQNPSSVPHSDENRGVRAEIANTNDRDASVSSALRPSITRPEAATTVTQKMEAPSPAISGTSMQPARPRVKVLTLLGEIILELDAERAPISTHNFLDYALNRYYDGTIFHRVMPKFMIQGGGHLPNMNEKTSGFKPEIRNEWLNGLRNTRGTIAMARQGGKPDSGRAQFFINVVDNPQLDQPQADGAGYAVFGKVVEGMGVVDKIKDSPVRTHPKYPGGKVVPVEPIVIKSVEVIGQFDQTGSQERANPLPRQQAVTQLTDNLRVECEGLDKLQNGKVRVNLVMRNTSGTQKVAIAFKDPYSDGMMDFWKFNPSARATLTDSIGTEFSVNEASGLQFARTSEEWTILSPGEQVPVFVDFLGPTRSSGTLFNFTLDLWISWRDSIGNMQKKAALVQLRKLQ